MGLMKVIALIGLTAPLSCGSNAGRSPPPPPPCDQKCADGDALRAMREMVKLVYNVTLQGKPVGQQDATTDCPFGGKARVFGTATSNALIGATDVQLTYEFHGCGYQRTDSDPDQTYAMTLDGSAIESGTIAIQPSATTSLTLKSDGMAFSGTVHDAPPKDFKESGCAFELVQSANHLSGRLCGRDAAVDL
jgi:hypothetical protein